MLCKEAEQRAVGQEAVFTRLRADLAALSRTPEDVVTDYLSKLWEHTFKIIEKDLGKKEVAKMDIKVVITVPAIWDDVAKQRTLWAAINAEVLGGQAVCGLIGEPEAAALAVFEDLESQGSEILEIGDSFVICDCGGGTAVSTIFHSA